MALASKKWPPRICRKYDAEPQIGQIGRTPPQGRERAHGGSGTDQKRHAAASGGKGRYALSSFTAAAAIAVPPKGLQPLRSIGAIIGLTNHRD